MSNTVLIKNIKYLVTCDDKDNVFEHCNLFIEDGVIKYIGSDVFPSKDSIDASDMILYPGLINTHHHIYQIFTRNLPQVQNMELFPWLKTLYELWKNIDDQVIYHTSLIGMGELLKAGCTTCFDHHYVFPHDANNLIETQFKAADELGVRLHVSRGSMSLSKKDGGLPPDSVVQTVDEIITHSQYVIEKFHNPDKFSMHQVALAPCSPFSVTQDLMLESAKLARSYGIRLHTHLAETKDEENYIMEHFHMRPLQYMEKLGWLGNDVWFAHGIHFNEEELRLLAQTQTGIAHCPISNMKLSSGIARIPEMLQLDIPVGLAVDGSASNDGSNLLEELRVGFLLHRLQASQKAPSAYDFLKIATNGGARILGRDDIGSICVGKAADLFLINTNHLELTAATLDPKSLLGTVGYKGAVDYTIVNGKIVVQNGKLTTIDEDKSFHEANNAFLSFLKK